MSLLLVTSLAAAILASGAALYFSRRLRWSEGLRKVQTASAQQLQHENFMLVSGIAVDLLDTISAIDGHAQLLLGEWRGALSVPQRDSIRRIHSAAESTMALCRRMLELAMVDCGELKLVFSEIDLPGMIQQVVDEHGAVAAANRQSLRPRLSSSIKTIDSNPALLKSIYCCVLDVVMRHTARGASIELFLQPVQLSLEKDDLPRRYLCLSLTPDAPSLSADAMPALQSAPAKSLRKQAVGSGTLRIARQAAAKLGGDVIVQPRKATQTFYVLTPYDDARFNPGSVSRRSVVSTDESL